MESVWRDNNNKVPECNSSQYVEVIKLRRK